MGITVTTIDLSIINKELLYSVGEQNYPYEYEHLTELDKSVELEGVLKTLTIHWLLINNKNTDPHMIEVRGDAVKVFKPIYFKLLNDHIVLSKETTDYGLDLYIHGGMLNIVLTELK